MREIYLTLKNKTACDNVDILRQMGHNISDVITELLENVKVEALKAKEGILK